MICPVISYIVEDIYVKDTKVISPLGHGWSNSFYKKEVGKRYKVKSKKIFRDLMDLC